MSVGGFISIAFILGYSHASRLIDLGHDLGPHTPIFPFPGYIKFEFIKQVSGYNEEGNWVAVNNFRSGEHIGTKINAPFHNNPDGWKIPQIPLQNLIGPAVVFDISEKVRKNPDYSMTSTDVKEWISENGAFPNNSIVLVYTGWSSRYPDPVKYYGHETDVRGLRYPTISISALQTMLSHANSKSNKISGLGTDTPSPDMYPGPEEVHALTSLENIYLIENLNGNVKNVPPKGARLMVMPMKISVGTGAPSRVVAALPDPPRV